jgi:hypothetical protein
LGDSNAIKNLWPEPYDPGPGARETDVSERTLQDLAAYLEFATSADSLGH